MLLSSIVSARRTIETDFSDSLSLIVIISDTAPPSRRPPHRCVLGGETGRKCVCVRAGVEMTRGEKRRKCENKSHSKRWITRQLGR